MAHQTSLVFLTHPPRSSRQPLREETQDLFVLCNLAMEEAAQKFSELQGNKKPEDNSPHSYGTSYFPLGCGKLEVMAYAVLKVIADINCKSELFPEVMKSFSVWSLFNKFSRPVAWYPFFVLQPRLKYLFQTVPSFNC